MKNKYYKTFREFKQAIEMFFRNIEIYSTNISKFLSHKFEILKAD